MTTPAETPCGRGFHHYVGYYNSGSDYFAHTTGPFCGRDATGKMLPCPKCGGLDFHNDTQDADGKPLLRPLFDRSTYSTYVYSDEAVRHIGRHASGEVSTPFFIYL